MATRPEPSTTRPARPSGPFTERTTRVGAARGLLRRRDRERTGRFLVEGAQAVSEALRYGAVHELFLTERAAVRCPELLGPELLERSDVRISLVTERAAAGLSETTTPQGIVAVCSTLGVPVEEAVRGARLVTVLSGVSDPGNAGTAIRVADAAGADAVVFTADSVDPHNGKCVRASTGSLFHLPLAIEPDPLRAVDVCRQARLRILAADGRAGQDLDGVIDSGMLTRPTAWLFGSEAHGLDRPLLSAADAAVAVPLYGRAESLNLASAAAVCLYASARAQRHGADRGPDTGEPVGSPDEPRDRSPRIW